MVAAAAWHHFNCKRGLLVFHNYSVRRLGFSAEGELKTERDKNGREARDRCLQESSRLCPEAQIVSLTRAYFRIAPPIIFPRVLSLCTKGRLCTGVLFCVSFLCWAQGRGSAASEAAGNGELCPGGAGAKQGTGRDPIALGDPRLCSPFPFPPLAPVEPCQIGGKAAGLDPWHRSRVGMEQRALAVAECG